MRRGLRSSTKSRTLGLSLVLLLLGLEAPPASALLKKFTVRYTNLDQPSDTFFGSSRIRVGNFLAIFRFSAAEAWW